MGPELPPNGIVFQGKTILIWTTPREFLALNHSDRAGLIAAQTEAVLEYAGRVTGCSDALELVGRISASASGVGRAPSAGVSGSAALRPQVPASPTPADDGRVNSTGTRTLTIQAEPDPAVVAVLKDNYRFSARIKPTGGQENILRKIIHRMNRQTGRKFDFEVYKEKIGGFADTEFRSFKFSGGGFRYLEHALIYGDIARAAGVRPGQTDRQKIETLMDWAFVNASAHFTQVLSDGTVFNDYNDIPLGVMLRGMGSCDRTAWAMARLAQHAQIPAQIVYLYRDTEGPSFHTLLEARIDTVWRVVDPYNNEIHTRSLTDLASETDMFRNSVVMVNQSGPHAYLPIVKVAEMICRFYTPDQTLFVDSRSRLNLFLKDHYGAAIHPSLADALFSHLCVGKEISPDFSPFSLRRWDYTFWLRGYYYDNLYQIYKFTKFPFIEKLRPARLAQLMGRYEDAGRMFGQIDTSDGEDFLEEERDYFLILNDFYLKRARSLEERVKTFRKNHPKSPRSAMISYLYALGLKEMGRTSEAIREYPRQRNFEGRGWASLVNP